MGGQIVQTNYGQGDWLLPPNYKTSFLYGAEACAPRRVIEIEAALFAKTTASFRSFPSARATASAPLNTSAAAVVSTALASTPETIPE